MGVMLRPDEDPMPNENELARLAGLVPGDIDKKHLEELRRNLAERGHRPGDGPAEHGVRHAHRGWRRARAPADGRSAHCNHALDTGDGGGCNLIAAIRRR